MLFTPLGLLLLFFSPLPSNQFEYHCTLTQPIPNLLVLSPVSPFLTIPRRLAEDCRYLLSHLPTYSSFLPKYPIPFPTSLPFLPRGYLRHKSCEFQINLILSENGNLSSATAQDAENGLLDPLVVPTWEIVRAGGEILVTACVNNGLTGAGVAALGWYQVHLAIGKLNRQDLWERRQETLREMMVGIDDSFEEGTVLTDKWSWGIYEV